MPDYPTIATKVCQKYTHQINVLGILWVGSAAYGISDEFVDIDIRLVTQTSHKQPMDQFKVDSVKIEVDSIDSSWLTSDLSKSPDTEQFWIRDSSQILFDHDHHLEKLFKKLNHLPDQIWKNLEWQLFKSLFSSYDFHKSTKRNEFITSQMYVGRVLDTLSKFIFIYHHRAVPTFKWRWYFIKKDQLLDTNHINQLVRSVNNNDQQFHLLEEIEATAQELMKHHHWPEDQIKEPWRFN